MALPVCVCIAYSAAGAAASWLLQAISASAATSCLLRLIEWMARSYLVGSGVRAASSVLTPHEARQRRHQGSEQPPYHRRYSPHPAMACRNRLRWLIGERVEYFGILYMSQFKLRQSALYLQLEAEIIMLRHRPSPVSP